MTLTDITFEQIVGLLAVILVLVGFYNASMTAIKNHLEAKKRNNAPVDALAARIDSHDKMLANDKRQIEAMEDRIKEMEERIKSIREESAMTLRGVRALLSHEINGNSIDKLKESYERIDEYLIKKE